MPPPGRRNGPPETRKADAASTTMSPKHNRQRTREAWRRRPWLDCGCTDTCRCNFKDHPTPTRVDAYADACRYLQHHGLLPAPLIPEMREMWRRGDRDIVQDITTQWVVA